jgi:N-acetylglutamate synthase-like GNAT family acetyltransferase
MNIVSSIRGGIEMTLTIRRVSAHEREWADALAFRRAILRTPLGLDFSNADMEVEREDTLFIASDGQRLVGVVMMRNDGADRVTLRQMAVSEDMRGRHVGQQLLSAFEAHARDLGVRHISLAARKTAIGFYERLGYVAEDDEFIEMTIPHRHMSKALPVPI